MKMIVGCLLACAVPFAAMGEGHAFFAMDTGTKDAAHASFASQAELLKELGYAGFGSTGFKDVPEVLKELDARGLKLFTVYTTLEVGSDGCTYEQGLKEAAETLKGRDTIVWVSITSKAFKPSSEEGDARAVAMLREMADIAPNLRFAIYPHTGFWVERVEDTVRIEKKTDRKNVGVTFNLCHWLNAQKGKELEPLLTLAMPHLFVVTINGADGDGRDWPHLIRTLDRGSYDVGAFLKTLDRLGYKGPIGLQGYGIGGDVHENLKRSMAAWHKLTAK